MREVLLVYKELELYHQTGDLPKDRQQRPVLTISVDEKPGVQAIANAAADLPPVPREHLTVGRDYEYKRGHVCARVERKHRSREFVGLLKEIDAYCPKPPLCCWTIIRLIFRRKPGPIWQLGRIVSCTCTPPTRVVAESGRNVLWQNVAHLSEGHSRQLLGGASTTDSSGKLARSMRRPWFTVGRNSTIRSRLICR